MIQPLFPRDDDQPDDSTKDAEYILQHRNNRTIQPLSKGLVPPSPAQHHYEPDTHSSVNPAADLIRHKLETIYKDEPSTKKELAEARAAVPPRSKHQDFMYKLSTSGKPLAQIHIEWHNYYANLPDHEKHEVWQEFYTNSARQSSAYMQQTQPAGYHQTGQVPKPVVMEHALPVMPHRDRRSATTIKRQLVNKVSANSLASERAKQHLHSLLFGLGTGLLVLFILLFGFFNEMFIAPFIQPSRHVSSTPIIVSSNSIATTATPEVIIPKINVQIPVNYSLTTDNETDIENSLEGGVVHYASTSLPGQQGNTAIFGHSSNNIFNPGKYKFAFVLLHTLVPGDIFYLTYNKQIYTYEVFDRQIVSPNDVAVLNPVPNKVATATLITCDPPGTSNNRLVVWGEQISPDPSTTTAPTPSVAATSTPKALASEGPSLWSELIHWDF